METHGGGAGGAEAGARKAGRGGGGGGRIGSGARSGARQRAVGRQSGDAVPIAGGAGCGAQCRDGSWRDNGQARRSPRSEEHTSELQSLMRISYAVFRLKKNIERT